MSELRLSSGQLVTAGRMLAEGGEGKVFELDEDPQIIVKIYRHSLGENFREKLIAMIRMRSAALERAAAWPIDLVQDARGGCVGFVMPMVTAPGDIDQLSHPAEQRIAFPQVDYGFLFYTAMNLMRAAAALHAAGCVLGDVNQSNVRVLKDSTVRFIDVDSFQVESEGRFFPCTVGTPLFTPPELHGQSFQETRRTANHDSFGLSVLLFQLLMFGRHPFAGIPRDGHARTIEEAIHQRLYAYSARQGSGILPPPNTVDIESLGELAELFDRAFVSTRRPSASEWMHALDRTATHLKPCKLNPRHKFLHSSASCPLCVVPRDPLPNLGPAGSATIAGDDVSIGALIREAYKLVPLRSLSERCEEEALDSDEQHIPDRLQNSVLNAVGGWVVAGAIVIAWLCPFEQETKVFGGTLGVMLGGIFIAVGHVQHAIRNRGFAARREEMWNVLDRLLSIEARAEAKERSIQKVWHPLWATVTGDRSFLADADKRLRAKLADADNAYRRNLFDEHLRRFIIMHARIPNIGPSRSATLASFGIETAADVDARTIRRIPGFGQHLTSRITDWRKQCERSFRNKRSARAPSQWIACVHQKHNSELAKAVDRLGRAIATYHQRFGADDRDLARTAASLSDARRMCRLALTQDR